MKYTVVEIKNSVAGLNSTLKTDEERFSKQEYWAEEITQNVDQKNKKMENLKDKAHGGFSRVIYI